MATIDFEKDASLGIPKGDLAQVSHFAQKMQELDSDIKNLEIKLKSKKQELERIASADLPDLLDALQLTSITLPGGNKVFVKTIIKASLPTAKAIARASAEQKDELSDRLKAGLIWLRDNGADAMIKNIVSAELGKSSDKVAKELIKAAKELGIIATREESVHPQTLSSYVREKLEAGIDVPFDTFAVYSGRKATITASR